MSTRDSILELRRRIAQTVPGQDHVIDVLLIALLADGHILEECCPGWRAMSIRALAQHLESEIRRIQFTPDLLVSDFACINLFGNLLIVNDIDCAPAEVQAVVWEAMENRQMTVAGTTRNLPELFLVYATMNQNEQEGNYPLTEEQRDRFLVKIVVDDLTDADLMRTMSVEHPGSANQERPKIAQKAVLDARAEVRNVFVSEAL